MVDEANVDATPSETVDTAPPKTVDVASSETVDTSTFETDDDAPSELVDTVERFDVIYSCLRCGTHAPAVELERLPEIKCICGFRVFVKNRPPIVKTVSAV